MGGEADPRPGAMGEGKGKAAAAAPDAGAGPRPRAGGIVAEAIAAVAEARKARRQSVIWVCLLAFFIALFLFSGLNILFIYLDYKGADDEYKDLYDLVFLQPPSDRPQTAEATLSPGSDRSDGGRPQGTPSDAGQTRTPSGESPTVADGTGGVDGDGGGPDSEPGASPEGGEGGSGYTNPYIISKGVINFALLKQINEDVIGWIEMPWTAINYPVVRGVDNEQYLRTTFRGESRRAGSIFMDYRNAPGFTDRNTIVYGHNMRDGTMFSKLTDFTKQWFYDANKFLVLYTPVATYRLEVFSAYVSDPSSPVYRISFGGDARFREYLDYIVGLSSVRTAVSPDVSDRIVTLSTCEYSTDDSRMLVHCRLVEVE